MTNERDYKRGWISDALIVAGCTAVSYLYAAQYQRGFLGYYGIPPEIAEIGIGTVIGAASIMITVIFAGAAFFLVPTMVLPKKSLPWGRIVSVMPLIVTAGVRMWAYGYGNWREWSTSAMAAGVLV